MNNQAREEEKRITRHNSTTSLARESYSGKRGRDQPGTIRPQLWLERATQAREERGREQPGTTHNLKLSTPLLRQER
jgi:hypothetical protein